MKEEPECSSVGKDIVQERDLSLWKKSQGGDEDATAELLRLYKGLVRSVAEPFFLQGGEQDDLLQEGMIGLLQAIQQYEPNKNAKFRTFARICISRSMKDAVRTASRKRHQPLNESLSLDSVVQNDSGPDYQLLLGDVIEDDAPAPDQKAISAERLEAFNTFMQNNLSDLELAVAKGLNRGLTYQEMADALGRSSKSIDNAIQRLRKKLRAYRKSIGDENAL